MPTKLYSSPRFRSFPESSTHTPLGARACGGYAARPPSPTRARTGVPAQRASLRAGVCRWGRAGPGLVSVSEGGGRSTRGGSSTRLSSQQTQYSARHARAATQRPDLRSRPSRRGFGTHLVGDPEQRGDALPARGVNDAAVGPSARRPFSDSVRLGLHPARSRQHRELNRWGRSAPP